jgi:hypothetical protein
MYKNWLTTLFDVWFKKKPKPLVIYANIMFFVIIKKYPWA